MSLTLATILLAASAVTCRLMTDEAAFVEKETVSASVCDALLGSKWCLHDWRHKEVASGPVAANGRICMSALPVGYYYLSVLTHGRVIASTTFPVVPDPSRTHRSRRSFYGVDAAFSTVCRPGRYKCPWAGGDAWDVCADLLWKAGVSHVRERLRWSEVNPAPGVWDFEPFKSNAKRLRDKGLFVCDVFHDVPPFVAKGFRVPRDIPAVHGLAEKLALEMGEHLDAVEVWNEEDVGTDPVWDYASMMRAAFCGFKSVRPGLVVANGSFCKGTDTFYAQALAANGIATGADVMNMHTYVPIADYERLLAEVRRYLLDCGVPDRQVWYTESGCAYEGPTRGVSTVDKKLGVHSPAQEEVVAEFYPKSQVALQMNGVSRNYFFVFGVFHEQGGRKDWGMIRPDGFTVKPVYSAMAQMTSALSESTLLGAVDLGDRRLAGYLFANGDGSETLVFWSKDKLDGMAVPSGDVCFELAFSGGELPRLVDMMGRPLDAAAVGGRIALVATQCPAYLTGRLGLEVCREAVRKGTLEKADSSAGEDLSTVVRIVPCEDDFKVGEQGAVLELEKERGRLTLEYWNLSDARKQCRAILSGGDFGDVPAEFAVEPHSCKTIETLFSPDSSQGDRVTLFVGGVADGRRIAPIVADMRNQRKFMERLTVHNVGLADDSIAMKSSASVESCTVADGVATIYCRWDDLGKDRWAYPEISAEGADIAGAAYLEFEVRSEQNKPENDYRTTGGAFRDRFGNRIAAGPLDFRYTAPSKGWEVRRVELPAAARACFGKGPLRFSIGGNPNGTELRLQLRNVRFLCEHKKTDEVQCAVRSGIPEAGQLPIVDISGDAWRQTVVAAGTKSNYQGHPSTLLSDDGHTLFAVWTLDHGGNCGPMARSDDGGLTWARMDDALPHEYRLCRNCPILQKIPNRDGRAGYFVLSCAERGGLGRMASFDGGRTWTCLSPVRHIPAAMPPTGLLPLRDGSTALFGQMFKSKDDAKDRPEDDQSVWMSVSRDGGRTWGECRVVAAAEGKNLCEPFALRSPDGKEICLLMRENRHTGNSMMCFSRNEGKTWTKPVDTCWGLTGDRHEGVVLPDGRLVIAFRDRAEGSSTYGQYVAWVGTWNDLRNGGYGQYRIHLVKSHAGGEHGGWIGDTGYSGVELLPDGTIVCTTYSKIWPDGRMQSVVSTRFRIVETDALRKGVE